jgi:excisionase family DNA binding protein
MASSSRAGRRVPPHSPALFEDRLGISIDEAARALGVQRDSVYRFIHAGQLTASKLGSRTIVHTVSIHQLLDATVIVPKPTDPLPAPRQARGRAMALTGPKLRGRRHKPPDVDAAC